MSFSKRSETEPPATERKAEPAKPVRKRKIISTAMLLAKATGKLRTGREKGRGEGEREKREKDEFSCFSPTKPVQTGFVSAAIQRCRVV